MALRTEMTDEQKQELVFREKHSASLSLHSLKNFVRWWLPVVVWLAVIFAGSAIGNVPRVGNQTTDGLVHRLAHILEYAVLGALLLRAQSRNRRITKREWIMTILVLGLYGASDEFHQRFTPGRSSEGIAVVFDIAGGMLGAWVYGMWRKRRPSSQSLG